MTESTKAPRRAARRRPPEEIPVHRTEEPDERDDGTEEREPEAAAEEDAAEDRDTAGGAAEDDQPEPEDAAREAGKEPEDQAADEPEDEGPDEPEDEGPDEPDDEAPEEPEPDERRPRVTARRAAIFALEQLVELTGRAAEGIVGVERDHDGWKVTIEAVEDRHVPSTADIMAEYEVELDGDGELVAYHRRSRYVRGQT
ncbi:gas vesicle protein GvpO [Georgenia ruanii]|uniref:Gas vesicle protein n=1 Tax=Georgenia ruanii TaxID=348442 RepID=A0A7J9UZ96_9MICO|nr:gas vesicle protein GvpO [Georgenia ruanii]MPV89958.1 hypothetical protein [Georgenia ruanii]